MTSGFTSSQMASLGGFKPLKEAGIDIMGGLPYPNRIGPLGFHASRIHRSGNQEVDKVVRGNLWLVHS